MKYIGAHVSTAGGVDLAPERAAEIGAKAFALFTGSSSRWKSAMPSAKVIGNFKDNCDKFGFEPRHILPHDNFLINLGSPDSEKLEKSLRSFVGELERVRALGLTMLNFHPGSHLGKMSEEECLDRIAESLNRSLSEVDGVTAVIENTAGQGSNLGYSFAQIARIIEGIDDKTRVGVCVDTCHAYSAGYDLRTEWGYERTWEEFDRLIGFDRLCGMHLNDDKRELASRIDRHEQIGCGTLGADFFARLMRDPRFDDIPLILETPDEAAWEKEIRWLYEQCGE